MSRLDRRDFLRLTVSGVGGLVGGHLISSCRPEPSLPAVTSTAIQPTPTPAEARSSPTPAPHPALGRARGIAPGRVVWAFDPDATRWDGATGFWWQENNRPMGTYNALVDLMGHRHLGAKTLLFVIDGLYATPDQSAEVNNAARWQFDPFDDGWTSSLLISQDGVAIDSVGLDFLRSEPTIVGNPKIMPPHSTCENFLHEAALAWNPTSDTRYDPDGSDERLPSLGVHEHWNNSDQRLYSRNLGTGTGIELIQIA